MVPEPRRGLVASADNILRTVLNPFFRNLARFIDPVRIRAPDSSGALSGV